MDCQSFKEAHCYGVVLHVQKKYGENTNHLFLHCEVCKVLCSDFLYIRSLLGDAKFGSGNVGVFGEEVVVVVGWV